MHEMANSLWKAGGQLGLIVRFRPHFLTLRGVNRLLIDFFVTNSTSPL